MDDKAKLELAGWALGAFVLVFLAVRFLHHGSAAAVPVSLGPPEAHAPARRSAKKLVVVDVEGGGRPPGSRRVAAGSAAAAAASRAGGPPRHGDATAVNLAAT